MPREQEYELVGGDEHGNGEHEHGHGEEEQYGSEHGLPRIPGRLPPTTFLLALVEFAERASYYGVSGVFANFVQRPLPPGSSTGAPIGKGTPGALGMGLGASTAVTGLFTVMAFASPLVGWDMGQR